MTEPAPSYSRIQVLKDIYYGFRPNKPKFLPTDYPDLTGKTAIVTGSNTGIGLHVMRLLYEKNCNVISVVRTQSKGEAAKEQILKEIPTSKGSITVVSGCDFLDLANIKAVGLKIKEVLKGKPISIIIHNAGLMASNNLGTSKQGYEAMFQTNVLGPQLLQSFLDPLYLKKDDDLKRIVWVSSGAHLLGFPEYGINWEDPCFLKVPVEQRPSANTLYGQSKAGNIMQAKAWATVNKKIVEEIGCVSTSVYPGNLNTDLQRDWNWLLRKASTYVFWDGIYGAYSELYSALSPELTIKDQGAYVVPFGEIQPPRADLVAGLKNGTDLKFWEMVEEMIAKFK
ncbi:hypothetical protein TBLA_0B00420 [Henningerozyma blattae CBS 6284]|uniref:Ketoreductase (KR) domain-containing protein n=1 Tax=Henningerozyma blattae (strain ATCC 34711 / CBS 6284 / DSM 70876 / NBRC 10599 / NRRL Y-10934 / UCD 77-7) TaxID=1071380 RepID=I2GXN4_HENB6|nr:hypothetical protein TBLA_0B00420 [Tetrapisispora blattae CBS 6284]CCH58886.1 hypothetical protein TBLA_0B00420 [Tetrapisispora blattae CBS 6284]